MAIARDGYAAKQSRRGDLDHQGVVAVRGGTHPPNVAPTGPQDDAKNAQGARGDDRHSARRTVKRTDGRARRRKEIVMVGIEGKVVAITGASSGIGEATAILLAARGAKVVLGARGSERLAALAERIEKAGGSVASVPTDARRRSDLGTLVGLACDRYGRLDVLFSNAGVMPISPLSDLRVADWDEMIDINIKGVLYGIAAGLPVFRKQGFGHFVHTASTAAHKTVPTQSVYSGTKFAVRAISDGLRQEVGSEKLRVTVISPGFTRTNFAEAVGNTEVRARLIESRDTLAMSPDAVARAVLFAIEQPSDVDVGEIVIRPTAQA